MACGTVFIINQLLVPNSGAPSLAGAFGRQFAAPVALRTLVR
jgi:hypothetical protein